MLCSRDFFNQSKYNNETKEQLWMSILSDTHESICACNFPFAHLLSIIFPLGHSDRDKTINDILRRDYKEKCLGGGTAGDATTLVPDAAGTVHVPIDTKEKDPEEEGSVTDLLNAVTAAENSER